MSAERSINSPGTLWVTNKHPNTTKAIPFDVTAIHQRFVVLKRLSSHPRDQLAPRMTASVDTRSRITLAACINW